MRIQTWLYSLAQALALTSSVISVSISPIVGKMLSPVASLSTMSYGAQFATVILCSYVLSMSMKRFGRKPVFYLGALSLAFGGILGASSIYLHSFILNVAAHISFGVSVSAFAYFRFAATDGLQETEKSKVISLVTLGGVAAAFVGPMIAKHGRLIIEDYAFSGSYLAFLAIALFILVLLFCLPAQEKPSNEPTELPNLASHKQKKLFSLPLNVAIYASGFGYMLMALLMMQSSLKLNAMNVEFADIMFVIQCHVVAMFFPSLFMGRIISATSAQFVILCGYITMFVSMLIAVNIVSYNGVLVALIGVGLGWNMLYVGGSSMVATLPGDAHKLQGVNESAVAFLNTIGAFSAGALFYAIGWENSNYVAMFLLMPGLVLLMLNRLRKNTNLNESLAAIKTS
jgi:MFS family permease